MNLSDNLGALNFICRSLYKFFLTDIHTINLLVNGKFVTCRSYILFHNILKVCFFIYLMLWVDINVSTEPAFFAVFVLP